MPTASGNRQLLRVIGGTEEPHTGQSEPGHNVIPAFCMRSTSSKSLRPGMSVLEQVADGATDKTEVYLRTILGCFMFSGEDVEKKIQVLSGGERSRVALAKTLLSEANFLLLDEPTNHLDIPSIQVLIEALKQYRRRLCGGLRRRWFLDQVANKNLVHRGRALCRYPGTYAEFAGEAGRRRRQKLPRKAPSPFSRLKEEEKKPEIDYQTARKAKNRLKKDRYRNRGNRSRNRTTGRKTGEISRRYVALPEVASDFAKLSDVQAKAREVAQALSDATDRWEALHVELEELEGMAGN
ncbi:MAG: ATP-binding cassette domain-containing protein [Bacteroidia bacterium]